MGTDELKTAGKDNFNFISMMLSRIAHDLGNPLSAILGFSELLGMDGISDEKRRRYVEHINVQAGRANSMLQNMASLGQKTEVSIGSVGLASLVQNLLVRCRQVSPHIVFEFEIGEDLGVLADSSLTMRVLEHLVGNATNMFKQAGTAEPRVEIRANTLSEQGLVRIFVSDNGPGVLADDAEKIFEPFYSRRNSGGLGLGLYSCRQMASLMNGKLSYLAPAPGIPGATFALDLEADLL